MKFLERERQQVEQWNAKYKPGQKVLVITGLHSSMITKTTSEASMDNLDPVIRVKGSPGVHLLSFVKPYEPEAPQLLPKDKKFKYVRRPKAQLYSIGGDHA